MYNDEERRKHVLRNSGGDGKTLIISMTVTDRMMLERVHNLWCAKRDGFSASSNLFSFRLYTKLWTIDATHQI